MRRVEAELPVELPALGLELAHLDANKIVKLAVDYMYNYKFEICWNIEGFKILGLDKFIDQEEKIDRKENLTNN